METLEHEILKYSNHPGNPDSFCCRYKIDCPELDITITYPSYEYETLEQNFFRLVANSRLVDFKASWHMRPDYASFDMYETPIFWYVILFANSIPTIEDFKGLNKVIIPLRSVISDLISEKVPMSDVRSHPIYLGTDLSIFMKEPFDELKNKTVLPEVQNLANQLKENLKTKTDDSENKSAVTLREVIDIFYLTDKDVQNKYVKLTKSISNETSAYVFIGNSNIPFRYGYDYIVSNSKIIWDSNQCLNKASTLDKLVEAGLKIRIKYTIVDTQE